MKKMKLTSMIIQGGLLIAFSGGFYFFTQTQIKPTEVYTYGRDISVNTVLTEGDLVKKYIPKEAVTPDMATNPKEIIGKAVTTKVYPGEYVIKQKLIKEKNIDPFELIDLSNYRKVSIPISMQEAVGGNLKKGDKVDLSFIANTEATGDGVDKEFVLCKNFSSGCPCV